MGGNASKLSGTGTSVVQKSPRVVAEEGSNELTENNASVEILSSADVVIDDFITKSDKLQIGREPSLTNNLLHSLRQASISSPETIHECFCTDPVIGDIGHLRLKCLCLIHYHCLVSYIRNKLGDRSFFLIGKGICCPYMRECKSLETEDYFINLEDLEALVTYVDTFSPRSLSVLNETLTRAEIDKFLRYMNGDDDNDEIITTIIVTSPSSEEEEDLSEKYINATTKPCPSCAYRATHFHGHMCHHVNEGCMKCHTHYCYRCLCSAEENFVERGSRGACKCGAWSNFCSTIDLINNLELSTGFPIDKRCGCGPCPECVLNRPCGTCNGRCCVCIGMVSPGPVELVTKSTWNPLPQNYKTRSRTDKNNGIEAIRAREEFITQQAQINTFLSLCGSSINVSLFRDHMTLDVNVQGRRGYTGLYAACIARNYPIVKFLVTIPTIRLDIRSMDGSTPLHYCCSYGILEIAKLLLDYGAGIDATDNNGWTPLYISCVNGMTNVVKFLLERGARCHLEVSNSGWRPLHAAAYSGDVGAVEALISYGAEIDCLDRYNRTPLFVAALTEQVSVIPILLTAGADKFIEDCESSTPEKLIKNIKKD